jgi:hypothetical protein
MLVNKTGSGWVACGLALPLLGVTPHFARSSTTDRSPDNNQIAVDSHGGTSLELDGIQK